MKDDRPGRPWQKPDRLLRVGYMVGVGPAAALPSALLGVLAWGLEEHLGLPAISAQAQILAKMGWSWMALGLGLGLYSLLSLPPSRMGRVLCTSGAYHHLRHPQYAAAVWFLAPGLALVLDSYLMLAWAALQLPLWRSLARREDAILEVSFGQDYRDYAAATGGFWPRRSPDGPEA